MCATNAVSNLPFLAKGCHAAARKGRSLKCGGRFPSSQVEPILAAGSPRRFPGQPEADFLSHPPPISRVDGILIDETSSRNKPYLS